MLAKTLFSIDPTQRISARRWMIVALTALVVSGIAPLLLVAGRASRFADSEAIKDLFLPALVVHVNLSVGLWFLAMAAMIWSLLQLGSGALIGRFARGAMIGAIACIALSPLAGGETYTSNYIPVQDNALFFLGLGFATSAILLSAGHMLARGRLNDPIAFLGWTLAATLIMALACFLWSVRQHPAGYGGESYYEMVFWGGGHVLQLAYVQIGLIAWLWLACQLEWRLPPRWLILFVAAALFVTVCASPAIYWLADINEARHLQFFTWQMNGLTGTLPSIIGVWLLVANIRRWKGAVYPAISHTLVASLILYFAGGATGLLIEGSDVTIPAHYHGSTGAITLAAMGLCYLLAPQFGWADPARWKLARWQPWLYCIGQLLFVTGFILAGGYDVPRKTAGSLDAAQSGAEFGITIYRNGSLLAIIGGALFIIVMIRAWRQRPRSASPAE